MSNETIVNALKSWQAELLLLLITFIWGGTFLFTKLGLQDCPPSLYMIIRFSIALLISIIFFGKYLFVLNKKVFLYGIVLGLFFGGGFVLQTFGLKYTLVSKSAFITGITVLITPFVFWVVERKKISIYQYLGVAVATIGLWLFTNPQFDNLNVGDVLTLGSTFFWAFYITYMDVFTREAKKFSETMQLVMLQFIVAIPLCMLAFFVMDYATFYFNLSDFLVISLLYNGIIASFGLTTIHTSVQKYSTPVKAALIFSLEPIVASLIAMIAINEIMNTREYIGAGILILGVLIAEIGNFVVISLKKVVQKHN